MAILLQHKSQIWRKRHISTHDPSLRIICLQDGFEDVRDSMHGTERRTQEVAISPNRALSSLNWPMRPAVDNRCSIRAADEALTTQTALSALDCRSLPQGRRAPSFQRVIVMIANAPSLTDTRTKFSNLVVVRPPAPTYVCPVLMCSFCLVHVWSLRCLLPECYLLNDLSIAFNVLDTFTSARIQAWLRRKPYRVWLCEQVFPLF